MDTIKNTLWSSTPRKIGTVLVGLIILIAATSSGGPDDEPEAAPETTIQETATTVAPTTEPPVETTEAPSPAPIVCVGPMTGVEATMIAQPGETCDDVLGRAAQFVPESVAAPGTPAQRDLGVLLCSIMQGAEPMTTAIPEYSDVADAMLANGLCEGDRSLIVFVEE